MAKEDILKRIEKVKDTIWYLEMADFLDWKKYDQYKKELKELEKALSDLEG